MQPSSSKSRPNINDQFIGNPILRLHHPPGGCDTMDREKARTEEKGLKEAQNTWQLFSWRNFEICIYTILVACIVATWTRITPGLLRLRPTKWTVFTGVVVAGRIISHVVIWLTMVVTKKTYGTRHLYFLYAVEKPVKCILWYSVVLASWWLVLGIHSQDPAIRDSQQLVLAYSTEGWTQEKDKTLGPITNVIGCMVTGATLWMLKILWVKQTAISFTKARYFDRIKDVLFAQSVIRSILGVQMIMEGGDQIIIGEDLKSKGQKPLFTKMPIDQWKKLNAHTVPASTLRLFAKIIRYSTLEDELRKVRLREVILGLATRRGTLSCERTALLLADEIFDTVAKRGAPCPFIECNDLTSFMPKVLAEDAILKIVEARTNETEEGAHNHGEKITRTDLRQWLVTSLKERRKLELILSDTHHALKHANRIVGRLVLLLIMSFSMFIVDEIVTEKFFTVLLVQSAILLLLCRDMVKRYLQSFHYFFQSHPVDVGDVCKIEGKWMIVQQVNLLETTFLTEDNLLRPMQNSTLLTLWINKEPDH